MHRPLGSTIAVLALALTLACTGDDDTPAQPAEYNGVVAFQTVAAADKERDFTIYWFGADVDIDGHTLRPYFVDVSGDNSAEALSFTYGTEEVFGPILSVGVSAPALWPEIERELERPQGVRRVVEPLAIAGANSAQLFRITQPSIPDNLLLRAVVRYPDAIVTVSTRSMSDDGVELNPLSDPDAFAAFLQDNLRPYPD